MKRTLRIIILLILASVIISHVTGYRLTIEKKEESSDFSSAMESASLVSPSNLLILIHEKRELLAALVVRIGAKDISYVDSGLFSYIAASFENSDSPGAAASCAFLAKTGVSAKYVSMPLSLVCSIAERLGGIYPRFEKEVVIGSNRLHGDVFLDKAALSHLFLNLSGQQHACAPLLTAFLTALKERKDARSLMSIVGEIYKGCKTNLNFAGAIATIERAGGINTDGIKKFTPD